MTLCIKHNSSCMVPDLSLAGAPMLQLNQPQASDVYDESRDHTML